ncbi:hypothetical protein JWS13_22235 [Rhodococcus pseudokoreensis]|uniref:Uncharacterized protein n=1 Tax=Rhodococcus pseudokoreensis TaxID=2811421 RepID=A0A974W514_9NOCA|nr:hypothetical protein [Rhodococcus pseudokoreensis]QSE91156.1 hypothetical protein JWS13_22235 [Rhodococcus pseudokoreensis]
MEPTRMLRGARVMRIVWLPGSDLLEGECHCGARHVAEEPAALWEWLLACPDGHHPVAPPVPAAPESAPVPV